MKPFLELVYLGLAILYLAQAFWRRYRKKNPDDPAAERAFIIFLLCLLLSQNVFAQPTRPWVMTPDSNVVAPYVDIMRAASLRLETDSLADSYFEEGRELEQAKQGLLKSLADCVLSAQHKQETIELYKHDLSDAQQDAAKFHAQARTSKRWTWTLAVLFLGSVTLHLAR